MTARRLAAGLSVAAITVAAVYVFGWARQAYVDDWTARMAGRTS